MRRLMREWHEQGARMSAQLEETLSVSGSMLVKTFGRQEHEAARFDQFNNNLRALSIRRMLAGRWFTMATSLFGALVPGLVYWYGGRAVVGNELSIGSVVALAVLTQRVFQPFATIARVNTTALASLALFDRIFEYLELDPEIVDAPDAIDLAAQPVAGRIRFRDVSFTYPTPPPVPAAAEVSAAGEASGAGEAADAAAPIEPVVVPPVLDLTPFGLRDIDFEARRSELHIHTFAAYPDQVTMVKTQSLFDFQ
jgi:ABC-type multidrug transport system fused ATPase/permease subunit